MTNKTKSMKSIVREVVYKNGFMKYLIRKYVQKDHTIKDIDSTYLSENPVLCIKNTASFHGTIYYKTTYGVGNSTINGLFALVKLSMEDISFAELFSLKPYVIWGKGTMYYDDSKQQLGENVFNYYFKPLCSAKSDDDICFIPKYDSHRAFFLERVRNGRDRYVFTEDDFSMFSRLYKKYFVLNESTETFIRMSQKKIIEDSKVYLGVHVRGTDFKQQFKDHPHFAGFEPYILATEKAMEKMKADKIFLATDDLEALRLFKNRFGGIVVYYDDCARAEGDIGVHIMPKKNPYEAGLEVLRDVYTLTRCDALVCGLSQVSFAARYIKASLGQEYHWVEQVSMEINQ